MTRPVRSQSHRLTVQPIILHVTDSRISSAEIACLSSLLILRYFQCEPPPCTSHYGRAHSHRRENLWQHNGRFLVEPSHSSGPWRGEDVTWCSLSASVSPSLCSPSSLPHSRPALACIPTLHSVTSSTSVTHTPAIYLTARRELCLMLTSEFAIINIS